MAALETHAKLRGGWEWPCCQQRCGLVNQRIYGVSHRLCTCKSSASPQILGLITRSRKLRSPSMSRRQRSALSLVPDHNGRHHRDRAVRRDIGVVATLS